jgi:hypothetical protein
MTDKDIRDYLNDLGNKLVPVQGFLMHIACSNGRVAAQPEIHEADCDCRLCRCFLSVQDAITKTDAIVKALDARNGGKQS